MDSACPDASNGSSSIAAAVAVAAAVAAFESVAAAADVDFDTGTDTAGSPDDTDDGADDGADDDTDDLNAGIASAQAALAHTGTAMLEVARFGPSDASNIIMSFVDASDRVFLLLRILLEWVLRLRMLLELGLRLRMLVLLTIDGGIPPVEDVDVRVAVVGVVWIGCLIL